MKRNMNSAATGAAFGLFIGIIYVALQYFNGSFNAKTTLLTGLVTAIAAGVLFGLYVHSFAKRQASEFNSVRERLEKEGRVYLDDAANHMYNGEQVGGRLYLTDEGLYFMANPMNVLSHSVKIPFGEMNSVRLMKQMGFVNGIVAETEKNSEYFSVSKPRLWLNEIEEKIKEA